MIFIPFIDGLLSYDCKECGYACCQSGNLIMNLKEKNKLLKTYTFLKYFFTRETKKTYAMRKYPRCWFLENGGLCHIQKKYGYSYKPFICRLHPFYISRCRDEFIVVPQICSTLHVDRKNNNISHKQILKNAKEAIDYNNIHGEIAWPTRRLNLEKEILKGSKRFINNSNYLDFATYQIAITKNKNAADIKTELLGCVNLWKSFLKVNALNLENKRLTYELTTLTSLLRVVSPEFRQMEPEKIPVALLALYFYMLLFTPLESPAINPKTYAETYLQILSDIALGLLYLKNDDLKIKQVPLEARIRYLRQLQMLHMHNERN